MLDRAKNFLRKIAGESPGGVAHPVVEAVRIGRLSLREADRLFDKLEQTIPDPLQTLRGRYVKALKDVAKRDGPHTPRRDGLMY